MTDRLKENTEKILLHDCNQHSANSIVEECFNRSYAAINETVYAQGVYFATNAKYSHDYIRANQNNERCMFVVLILVEKSILGNTSMKVPPKGYDSTTDNNQIYVVYHGAQAYADYLITYQQFPLPNLFFYIRLQQKKCCFHIIKNKKMKHDFCRYSDK
ncbi:unnamed protein product [Rotaria socialis]|uniref:Poly [ADP-ribose] polymerase n=1 Tax=Rotaria socialis TaxID=392032 RepID=A0A818HNY3_9BILA|nr:unnamed protein product [Rotaria socialis]CAF3398199.1 unnamed protein product [Rotaria socialis]CAF3412623.1 unnamed protein product [Rotaria socialis]CAF3511066.1 unnamed protein product [Rotaria socialis]CAF3562104.1 unnamed protein product [Rotaria socialis]